MILENKGRLPPFCRWRFYAWNHFHEIWQQDCGLTFSLFLVGVLGKSQIVWLCGLTQNSYLQEAT